MMAHHHHHQQQQQYAPQSSPQLLALEQYVTMLQAEVSAAEKAVADAEVECVLMGSKVGSSADNWSSCQQPTSHHHQHRLQQHAATPAAVAQQPSSMYASLRLTALAASSRHSDPYAEGGGGGYGVNGYTDDYVDRDGDVPSSAFTKLSLHQDALRNLNEAKTVHVAEVRKLNEELMRIRSMLIQ